MSRNRLKKSSYILSMVTTFILAVNPLFANVSFATPTSTKSKVNQALAQYNAAKKQVEELQKKIAANDQKMTATFQTLEEVKERQQVTKKRLNSVLVRLYMSGQNSLQVQLLSAKSFSEFLKRLEGIRLLMDSDYQVISQYQKQADQIAKKQAEIKKEIAETKPLLQAAEQKMKQLQAQYKSLSALLKKERTRVTITDPGKLSNQSWLNKARAMIGIVKYRFGASSYPYFDCSSWTQYVFRTYRGINLPRTSSAQSTVGTPVSKSNLQPGDLVFFQGTYKAGISHVGIYLGNGYYISNKSEKLDLGIDSLNSSYSQAHYWGARRVN